MEDDFQDARLRRIPVLDSSVATKLRKANPAEEKRLQREPVLALKKRLIPNPLCLSKHIYPLCHPYW
jgi:hypothetical protein